LQVIPSSLARNPSRLKTLSCSNVCNLTLNHVHILRLQSFNDDAEKKPTLNLLSSFHSNPLLAEKLANCILPGMPTPPSATVPMTPSLSQTANTHEVTPTKRKRQRRNPVWPYFDVIDGTARCKQCLYSTKSVFSTNLKVHLRSHHRADYEKVIQAEDALNLNALLLSGNSSKLFSTDLTRKRMPPMTSSILMTINKCEFSMNLLLPSWCSKLILNMFKAQAQQKQQQQQQQAQQHQQQQQQQAQQQQHQQHHQQAPLALNAANLAALNQMARNQLNNADYFVAEMPSAPHGTDANGMPQPKRRRLRRHPVWMFFKDLEDRMVGCINCSFRTGSAFSTNLKMHLKAHHKDDYERVLKLEGDMRVEENVTGPPNKIKNELIDFIRGGGNASTATNGDFAISAVLSGMGFVTLELARALRIRAIQT
uniref:BED-type domain-containing protein n=1 Tax=Heligmosomoides polygyrus TaxID=6339 RepID=A0A8L8JXM9_HELPZ